MHYLMILFYSSEKGQSQCPLNIRMTIDRWSYGIVKFGIEIGYFGQGIEYLIAEVFFNGEMNKTNIIGLYVGCKYGEILSTLKRLLISGNQRTDYLHLLSRLHCIYYVSLQDYCLATRNSPWRNFWRQFLHEDSLMVSIDRFDFVYWKWPIRLTAEAKAMFNNFSLMDIIRSFFCSAFWTIVVNPIELIIDLTASGYYSPN